MQLWLGFPIAFPRLSLVQVCLQSPFSLIHCRRLNFKMSSNLLWALLISFRTEKKKENFKFYSIYLHFQMFKLSFAFAFDLILFEIHFLYYAKNIKFQYRFNKECFLYSLNACVFFLKFQYIFYTKKTKT